MRLLTFKSDIKVCGEKVSECMSSSFEVGNYESDPLLVVTRVVDERKAIRTITQSTWNQTAGYLEGVFIGLTGYFASLGFVGFCWLLLVFGHVFVPVPSCSHGSHGGCTYT